MKSPNSTAKEDNRSLVRLEAFVYSVVHAEESVRTLTHPEDPPQNGPTDEKHLLICLFSTFSSTVSTSGGTKREVGILLVVRHGLPLYTNNAIGWLQTHSFVAYSL
jgi:hypothetical protein